MLTSRKDLDELDGKFDFVIEGQHQLRERLVPLESNIERQLNEHLNLLQTLLKSEIRDEKEQVLRLANEVLSRATDEFKRQGVQVTEELKGQSQQTSDGLAKLGREMMAQLEAVRRENAGLRAQLEEHHKQWEEYRARWDETVAFAIRSETPAALAAWSAEMMRRLEAFKGTGGMVQLLAALLFQHFETLRALQSELESGGEAGFEGRLEELERILFAPTTIVSWGDLTPQNSTPPQRHALRLLETALVELRSHVKATLLRRTGIAPLEVVPGETRFDARVHTTSEFLESPTPDVARHGLILAVERGGFVQTAPDGVRILLQPARVRRSVFQAATPTFPKPPEVAPPLMRAALPAVPPPPVAEEPIASAEAEIAPAETLTADIVASDLSPIAPPPEAPRVKGQL